jgi:hypothetical protein
MVPTAPAEPQEPCPELAVTSPDDWPKPRPLCDACGQPAPTSVDDYLEHYAKDGPKTITVPSGAVFVVDKPPLEYMATTRRLHPTIAALVLEKGAGLLTGEAGIEPDDLMTFVDYCVSLSVVDPPVSFDEGVEGRIWVKQIPEADKRAVLAAVELEV